jgi:hypothetical protein
MRQLQRKMNKRRILKLRLFGQKVGLLLHQCRAKLLTHLCETERRLLRSAGTSTASRETEVRSHNVCSGCDAIVHEHGDFRLGASSSVWSVAEHGKDPGCVAIADFYSLPSHKKRGDKAPQTLLMLMDSRERH